MIRVAIVGTGFMGRTHTEAWQRIPQAELAGVTGRNEERTREFAQTFHIPAYDSVEQMLEQSGCDVLDICAPTYLHEEYASLAAAAGKHVICEKPLALEPAQAKAMIERCERAGVHLFVGHTLRFFSDYAELRQSIRDGKLGEIGAVHMSRMNRIPADSWFTDHQLSGGMIQDLLIHDLDWLRWTFGEVDQITAYRTVKKDSQTYCEMAQLVLHWKNGRTAHVSGAWTQTDFQSAYEIIGSNGVAKNTFPSAPDNTDSAAEEDPYQKQLEHFAQCLLENSEPIVTAHDGLKAVELARAAIESAEKGRTIHLGRE